MGKGVGRFDCRTYRLQPQLLHLKQIVLSHPKPLCPHRLSPSTISALALLPRNFPEADRLKAGSTTLTSSSLATSGAPNCPARTRAWISDLDLLIPDETILCIGEALKRRGEGLLLLVLTPFVAIGGGVGVVRSGVVDADSERRLALSLGLGLG